MLNNYHKNEGEQNSLFPPNYSETNFQKSLQEILLDPQANILDLEFIKKKIGKEENE